MVSRRRALTVAGLLGFGVAGAMSAAGGHAQAPAGAGVAAAGTTISSAGAPVSTPAGPGLQAPPSDRTHPYVLPRRGRRSTRFSAYFTLRRQPGHVGVLATDYRVAVARPPHSRARCEARVAPDVNGGRVGEVMRVALAAPIGGWCVGRYTVTILLERGPFCPPSAHPTPCPEFATQDLDTGRADFTVQAK